MKKLSLLLALGCGWLMLGSVFTSCDGYDLMDKDPDWLGSSIYDYLHSSGNYTYTDALITDLGYDDVLGKTGSKTLFVADDDAFQRFFTKNYWGVSSYSQLSTAQKKLLLYGSMINNSCQVAYLSSSEGPTEGDCMRRLTSSSVYDSVPLIAPKDMPNTIYWEKFRKTNKTIPCFEDMSTPPMVHLIEAYLKNKLITDEDVTFLQNNVKRNPGDANVNGIIMEEQNIKCSNGFVHKMAEVMTPLPNMAQLIHQNPNTSEFSKLIERFCAPYPVSRDVVTEYNRIYGTQYDSIYQKRYFSLRSHGGETLDLTPDGEPVNGTLKFDPGWNQFFSQSSVLDSHIALQENMGVMLVPTNAAMDNYWNNGPGKVLKDRYGTWDNVPDKVISKMLNVNMLNSFVNSVPSKFETVLNDANDTIGIKTSDVDSVYMACNGAVYFTNKVFSPVAYISVHFPALVNETMSVFNWGIEQLGFEVYLNSQNSYYSLFIPDNDAALNYVDPCSYGKVSTQLFRFHFKENAPTEQEKVWASIWNYNIQTGEITDSIGEADYNQIRSRLKDILDYHIIVGDILDGNTYYKTKGGGVIKVVDAKSGTNGMKIYGSLQEDLNRPVTVSEIYSNMGNGKTFILHEEPLMTTNKAVSTVLKEHEEFSAFWNLLESSPFLETKHVIGTEQHGCATENISLFNTFNYTVYVPTNSAIEALHAANKLPTWEQVDMAETDEEKDSLSNEIELFLKYHIQDNSVYIGMGNDSAKYETAAYLVEDDNLLYQKLSAISSNDGIKIIDQAGNTRNVVKTPGLYNIMVREYQYDDADATRASNLYTSSFAVIHQIDGCLQYKQDKTAAKGRKGGKK